MIISPQPKVNGDIHEVIPQKLRILVKIDNQCCKVVDHGLLGSPQKEIGFLYELHYY